MAACHVPTALLECQQWTIVNFYHQHFPRKLQGMYFILDRNECYRNWKLCGWEGIGGYNYGTSFIPRKTMEPEAVAPGGQLGLSFVLQSLGEIMCLNEKMSGISSGWPLLSFSDCFTEKLFFSTEKQEISLREGHRPRLPLCLEILDSEILPEREVSLFQFQLWLRKTNSSLLARQSKQRIVQMSSMFHIFSFSVKLAFFHGSN